MGKLSDDDYQTTKKDLQKELAGVLAEVDRVKLQLQGGRAPARGGRRGGRAKAAVQAGRTLSPARTAARSSSRS